MWGRMLRLAVGLGVQPEAFWRLSLKEWRALTEREPRAAMGRAELERLAERWPDGPSPPAASRRPPHEGEGDR